MNKGLTVKVDVQNIEAFRAMVNLLVDVISTTNDNETRKMVGGRLKDILSMGGKVRSENMNIQDAIDRLMKDKNTIAIDVRKNQTVHISVVEKGFCINSTEMSGPVYILAVPIVNNDYTK